MTANRDFRFRASSEDGARRVGRLIGKMGTELASDRQCTDWLFLVGRGAGVRKDKRTAEGWEQTVSRQSSLESCLRCL